MGKNVYAAPRKGPAGKWVENNQDKGFQQDKLQEKKARMQKLANQYKQKQEQE